MKSSSDTIIKTLTQNGFEAYYVGGSVRNTLHNKFHPWDIKIKDYDIVTNASYEQVAKLFENVVDRGEHFKVAVVVLDGYEFEVAQYRGEKYAVASTRPSEVFTVDSLEKDISRRDFTMNGIVMDEKGDIVDFVGGVEDIKRRVIRTIGNPVERFSEDPLRMLRAFRFAAQLGYNIEPITFEAIKECKHLLENIPHSRVVEEMNKIIKSNFAGKALMKMKKAGMDEAVFTNTILNKKVRLFSLLLNSGHELNKIRIKFDCLARDTFSIEELYYALYRNFSPVAVNLELEEMGLLNQALKRKINLLIKHKEITNDPSQERLLALVKEIKEQEGMKYLKRILETYKKVEGIDLTKILNLRRPVFVYQLQYNGEDVINAGKRHGFKGPGKWVKDVLELGREKSVLGEKFALDTVLSKVAKRRG